MSPDVKQRLIEKIEALPPNARAQVMRYIDSLLKNVGATADASEPRTSDVEEVGSEEERYLSLDWAGALSHLKDEYTSLELEEEIMKEWRKSAHD